MSRHGVNRSAPSAQFVFALVMTVVATIIVVLALRAIPAAERPTVRPVPSRTEATSFP
ncbi:MAG TPA: hypothetical protein VGJ38_03715 [Jatrophihabitantaceae bacterium]